MVQTISGIGFDFEVESIGGTWRWSVISNHIPGYGSNYQITNIKTPFGLLQQTLIPIPDVVISSMNDSILSIKQQFSPQLHVLSPPTLIFTGSATEGDSAINLGEIEVQNVGAFGSFMNVTATASAPWLSADPTALNDITKNDTGFFTVIVNPSNLESNISPYTATIILQDNKVPATTVTASVVFTVNPRPVIVTDTGVLGFTYYISTGSSTGALQLTITNGGPMNSVLSATLTKAMNQPWWTFTPSSVGPLASNASSIITISIVNGQVPLNPGTYTDKLRISSNNAANSPTDVTITLTVI